ncbi:MAG: D-aminoacyl-tRNA deacylase [Trueperella sp.]|nr:D-aminoacyl-tRNA deacylase [Trueperella sp.]
MKSVVQRVRSASVKVDGEVVGQIGAGLAVLVGITHTDGPAEIAKTARKLAELKLLRSPDGSDDPKDRVGAIEVGAPLLLVSQFTLYASVRKGRKPSWSDAAPGEVAEPIFRELVAAVREYGLPVETGVFGAMMEVALVNDGPFTVIVEV